jgi:hypothetical protein
LKWAFTRSLSTLENSDLTLGLNFGCNDIFVESLITLQS